MINYKRIYLLLPTFLLMLSLLSACRNEQKITAPPDKKAVAVAPITFEGQITIYVVGPMSGPDAEKGQSQAAGARFAAQELNQRGGLLHQEVIIKILNDAGNPEQSLELAQKIAATDERVIGVILSEGSDPQLEAVQQIYLAPGSVLNSLIIAPVSTNPLPVEINDPRFFRLSAPNLSQAAEVAKVLHEQALHDVVVVHNSTPYGKALAQEFEHAVGSLDVDILATFEISSGASSYADVVNQIWQLNPAALFYAGEDIETSIFLSELFGFEFQGKLFGSDRALLYSVLDELNCQAEGMHFVSTLPDPTTVLSLAQLVNFSALEGRDPEFYTVAGYSGVEFIVGAYQAEGTLEDAEKAALNARQTSINTLLGEISFDAQGDLKQPKVHFFQVEGHQFQEAFTREIGAAVQSHQVASQKSTPLLDMNFAPAREAIIFAGLDWDSAQLNNSIARFIIESGYGYPTHSIPGSSVPSFQSLRKGDIDIYMEVWFDNELYHEALTQHQIVEIGTSFEGATQSWAVPRYVVEGDPTRGIKPLAPDLKSVQDLERYSHLFAAEEQTRIGQLIDGSSGWFSYKVDCAKLKAYRLDDNYAQITTGSESAMFALLQEAYQDGRPILIHMWEPSWPMAKYDLIQLAEPEFTPQCWQADKKCAFPIRQVRIIAHPDLPQRAPEVVEFLGNFSMDMKELNQILMMIEEQKLTPQEAAILWLKENEAVWSLWMTDEVAQKVKKALQQ